MTERQCGQQPGNSPQVSVIVPVRDDPVNLEFALQRLRQSDYPHLELVVVDDGSRDDACLKIAETHGARVLRLPESRGPAKARNLGSEAAGGEILVFIDADVGVHRDTLSRFAAAFDDPAIAAVFGSYDSQPTVETPVSLYKNLLHHDTHHRGAAEAETFWTGCGAVRRELFLQAGGFNPGFARPCIEDIEFGMRLKAAGYAIRLDPRIQATHAKHWTFRSMCKSDIFDRALPWSRLIMQQSRRVSNLNVRSSQKICGGLASLSLLALLGALLVQPWLIPVTVLSAVAYLFLAQRGVDTRAKEGAVSGGMLASALLGLAAIGWAYPWSVPLMAAVIVAGCLLNGGFLWRLASVRSVAFAAAILPLHFLYFCYSTAVFAYCKFEKLTIGSPVLPAMPDSLQHAADH